MTHFNILWFLLSISVITHAQSNRALIVAIGNYPKESGWMDIHAENDVRLLVPMLKASGYADGSITLLTNEKATKSTIVSQLNTLYAAISKGDYIYLHFSCHGQQIMDADGDEQDGLDEALIPYDAGQQYIKDTYEGENHLTDDELGLMIAKMRAKAGAEGRVTIVVDACHSGSALRGEEDEYARGTARIFAPANYVPPTATYKSPEPRLRPEKEKGEACVTLFSACHDTETNYEYKDGQGEYYGALTYAMCSILQNDKRTTTNDSFYESLRGMMSRMFHNKRWKQTPYFETTDPLKEFKVGRKR